MAAAKKMDSGTVGEWIESWDRQQEVYVAAREQRFRVVIDTVTGLAAPPADTLRVLDLGCGPAALGPRLLDLVPTATYLGIDLDPVLLHLAAGAGRPYGGRFSLRAADLRSSSWADDLAAGSVDAIVSSTALHWLDAPDLARVFRTCRTLLHDGGVLVNADSLRFRPSSTRLQALSDRADLEHQRLALADGGSSWSEWWDRARGDEVLGPLCEERDRIYAPTPAPADEDEPDTSSETRPPLDLYIGLLHDAGFGLVDTVWQRYDDRILVALPDPSG